MNETPKNSAEKGEKLEDASITETPADIMERKLRLMREEREKEKHDRRIQEKKFSESIEKASGPFKPELSPEQQREKKIEELTAKLTTTMQEITSLKEQLAKVEAQRDEINERSLATEYKLDKITAESLTKTTELESKLILSTTKVTELTQSLEKAKSMNENLDSKLRELDTILADLKNSNHQFEKKTLESELKFVDNQRLLAVAEKKIAELELRKMVAERELENSKKIAESTANFGEFKGLITDLESKVDQAQKKNDELHDTLIDTEKELKNAEKKLDEAQKQINASLSKYMDQKMVEAKVLGLETRIAQLEEEKKTWNMAIPETVKSPMGKGGMNDLVSELQMKLERQKKEIASLQDKAKGGLADLVVELRSKVDRLQQENSRLKNPPK